MCTAATYKTDGFYFGRTLDYEFSYGDEIVVTPRRFPLAFSGGKALSEHFALLGMAHVADGYPLYYDAMNEKGLCMAGLNFVGNAAYAAPRGDEGDVAQFEFIPWVLAQCASVSEARVLLGKTNLTGTPFSAALPAAQLHWLLADKDECVTIESTADGLHVYDNPAGVLTNNPPFPQQLFRLNDYQSLSPRQPENTFAPSSNAEAASPAVPSGFSYRNAALVSAAQSKNAPSPTAYTFFESTISESAPQPENAFAPIRHTVSGSSTAVTSACAAKALSPTPLTTCPSTLPATVTMPPSPK